MLDYFPLGVASGQAFCNRTEELAHLKRNVQLVKPTLLMSPRRYGKTSLVLQALDKSKVKFSHIDLHKEVNEEGVELAIMNGIGELLGRLEPTHKKLMNLAAEFFSNTQFKVNLGIGKIGLSLEIVRGNRKPADNILSVLKKLEELASKRKETVALFIDEFQQLAEITDNTSIEASIRQIAQLSKHVVYIFSGSNRRLLEAMFFDKRRPFYKLCDLIRLERIESKHYYPYIRKALEKMTDAVISDEDINSILQFTENHPYYVNLLCTKLSYKKEFNEKIIYDCWQQCALEAKLQFEQELSLLSLNQKKLYISLARMGKIKQPTQKAVLLAAEMTSTSVLQALKVLVSKDYIMQDHEGCYMLQDPLHKYILQA